jgi:hypothetical protein
LDEAAVIRAGGRREGAKERAVAVATAAAIAVVIAPTYDTLSPSAFLQVNGYIPPYDAMRILPRYHASRGGQCASRELLGSLGRQLLTNYREAR